MSPASFTIDTDLKATASPITAAFIDEYLKGKRKGELSGIGAAAIAASKKYGINATYIVSHAALESGWGSSKIAKEKNNLYGWSAFDSSPYSSATGFPNRESCIDFVMGRIDVLYLTENGKYFENSACLGRKNPGGYGMNVRYASDPGWGSSIAAIGRNMEDSFMKTLTAKEFAAMAAPAPKTDTATSAVEALLARARSAAGSKTKYLLGAGGMKPAAAHPGSTCDCSGYVSWVLGLSRMTDHPTYKKYNGGWINTDAMVNDASVATGFFTKLDAPKKGCIIVYPKAASGGPNYGHVGIVTEVASGKAKKVIHCSSGNSALGDAIAETGPEVWNRPSTIFAWYDGLG